jgi:hypothetical protein
VRQELIPWLDRYREQRRKFVAQLEIDREARKAARRLNTRPSHDLADCAGDYDHPGYGRITITHGEGRLNWAYRGMSEPLAHRHYDTFELPEAPGRLLPDRLALSFATDREGEIANLAAPFEPLVKDIVFTRVPAGDCTNPAFRQHCTGTFSQGATTVVVGQDNDGQLTLRFGSQPTYKLRPYRAEPLSSTSSRASGWSSISARTGKWMNCSSISRMEHSRLGERRLRHLAEARRG